MGGRPADGRRADPRPGSPRPARPGPLVARPALPAPPRERGANRSRPGRVRRFVLRYGWRAYAVPLLTIATIAVLVDLALSSPGTQTAGAAAPTAATSVPVPTVESVPTAPAQGDVGPSQAPQVVGEETYVEVGEGSLSVVDGSSQVYGSGPVQRFIVEVEDGIDVDGSAFAAAVESTLGDPRSWGNEGRMSFQRVGATEAAAGQFDFKVSLVSPGNMETYCPGVGTGGYTSCRYGDRATINLARWATAVPDYQGDIATYRLYVINHEVGHVLGNGHEPCPGTGEIAPVMQQQTLGLDGCVKNAWPYP
ncbi:DUF3152 domain-containing protein [Blastococcus sp. CT_GayMR16]|uniref:DUF3152 domain-containing protein n=1 Tax=Blastococcus sp. CT_GayMR16 TaxID=2559607 RepID=UPI00247618E6|nr:DUF3152 domain-containing protein [Blastococcus sp. CT_GayMR16]